MWKRKIILAFCLISLYAKQANKSFLFFAIPSHPIFLYFRKQAKIKAMGGGGGGADGGSDIALHPEKVKIVATCLVVAVGVSLLGLYLKSGAEWRSNWSLSLNKKKKPIRVYMDGCFDMMHYGHCNALRQARALGDQLVVGVVSDDEIIANKGPPVTPVHERMIMVNAVKWVDEVISDAPYAITEDFMKKLFDEYNIDYIIHGDDPCVLPDGTDAYALAKKAGRYKQIKRTEGVSSTDIVGNLFIYLFLFFFKRKEKKKDMCVCVCISWNYNCCCCCCCCCE